MTSQRDRCSVAVAFILLAAVCTSVSSETSSPVTDVNRSSTSLLTSFVTLTMTSPVRNFTAASTSALKTTTSSVASTRAVVLGGDANSTTDTSNNVITQESSSNYSSEGPKFVTEYPISLNRTLASDMRTNHTQEVRVTDSEVTTNRTSTVTTSPLNRTTQLADMKSQMTSEIPVTSQAEIIVRNSTADYTSTTDNITAKAIIYPPYNDVDAKTKALAIGLGVGIGLLVLLLLIVIIAVSVSAKRRQRRRRSDKQKLAPSARNYDRVIHPSQVSSSSEPQSGAAKIRPGRRGNRRPSTEEVFALGVQSPPAADLNGSPSPPDSPTDQMLTDDPAPSKSAKSKPDRPGKPSSKKDDKSNAQRCLRGKPPELEKSYFVRDDDNDAGRSAVRKNAANDPFWEAPEAPATTRRPSIMDAQSTSLFRPPTTNDDRPTGTTAEPINYILLPSANIGQSSTDEP